MSEEYVVTIKRAAELLGGDKPISAATVRRMIGAGVLVARGHGVLRRVTVQSIRAYIEGVTEWRGNGAKEDQGKYPMNENRNSSSRERQTEKDRVVLLQNRKPNKRSPNGTR